MTASLSHVPSTWSSYWAAAISATHEYIFC